MSSFILVMVFLMANATVVYKSFRQFDEQKTLVNHTYEVINEISEIVSALKDVQSSQRGYLITGMVDYLTPYNIALPEIAARFRKLAALIADNPEQVERLQVLKQETDKRLNTAKTVLATFDKDGQKKAFDLVKIGTGKQEMEQIRKVAADMVGEEKALLNLRQARVDQAAQLTLVWGTIGMTVFTFTLAAVFFFVHRENARREQVERTLQTAYTDMKSASEQDRMISRMTDYLQGCASLEEAYDVIKKALPKIMPGSSGSISLFNNSRNMLEAGIYWGEALPDHDFAPDQCWALRRGQVHHHVPGGMEPQCPHISAPASGGSLCIPMQAYGDTMGMFYISAADAALFGEAGRSAIRRVSEQVSLAISNLMLQRTLREQSVRDPMTGLFNRRYLEETTERELTRTRRSNQPLSVLVLDIDHFKKYNDTRGHDAGDALLIQFAKLLQEKTRKEDIACRYGGEEFVIVLPTASREFAMQRANEICDATRRMKVNVGKDSFGSVTVSIGVATAPDHGQTTESLISMADAALYRAKHAGRDQVQAAG